MTMNYCKTIIPSPSGLSSPASIACEACDAREGDPGRRACELSKSNARSLARPNKRHHLDPLPFALLRNAQPGMTPEINPYSGAMVTLMPSSSGAQVS